MSKAFSGKPVEELVSPACFVGSRSHILNVRAPDGHCANLDRENVDEQIGARDTAKIAGKSEGGDRIDPRLFYFRALLDSGRFFGGESREARASNRK